MMIVMYECLGKRVNHEETWHMNSFDFQESFKDIGVEQATPSLRVFGIFWLKIHEEDLYGGRLSKNIKDR